MPCFSNFAYNDFKILMHYENLPVYKKAIELSVLMENVVKHFSRFHPYELGAEMHKLAREIEYETTL